MLPEHPPADSDDARLRAARERVLASLGVEFHDPALFSQALVHLSYVKDRNGDPLTSNERLEFLGDAVLQLAVSQYLFERWPTRDEGELSTRRAAAVRATSLAKVGEALGLLDALQLGSGLVADNPRGRRSVVASAFEAVIGAVLIDQGWATAREVALRLLAPRLTDHVAPETRNYKGELQELTQDRYHCPPEYVLLLADGPPHNRRFQVEVRVQDRALAYGTGQSKKDAEQEAAQAALSQLQCGTDATSVG